MYSNPCTPPAANMKASAVLGSPRRLSRESPRSPASGAGRGLDIFAEPICESLATINLTAPPVPRLEMRVGQVPLAARLSRAPSGVRGGCGATRFVTFDRHGSLSTRPFPVGGLAHRRRATRTAHRTSHDSSRDRDPPSPTVGATP